MSTKRKTSQKKKTGRPSGFNKTVESKILELAELGCTDSQIAEIIGVTQRTLDNWKKKNQEFFLSLKIAKYKIDREVEDSLLKSAKGFMITEQQAVGGRGEGQVFDVEKFIKPSVTAQIFWLKNRQPDKWREKQEVENKVTIDNLIFDDEGEDE